MGLEERCRETVWSRVAADRVRVGSDIRMNGRTSDGITFKSGRLAWAVGAMALLSGSARD